MKKFLCLLLLGVACAMPAGAQSVATTGGVDFAAERARLDQERKTIEARFQAEQKACYQKFAVQGCLDDSRQRRRSASDEIKRQEGVMNDVERKRRGVAALDRLDDKQNTPRTQDLPAQREQSVQSQKDREQRAEDHAASRARLDAEAAQRQKQFDDKQRTHAADLARAAERRAEAPTERERYERKLQRAAEHRADAERRLAERIKPRSAPLPTVTP